MNQNEIITAVVALMVCGVLAGAMAIPLIAGISQETTTEEYNDESNAGWLRMAYDNKPFDVEITADGDNITAGGQTGLNDDMILYADASACVMCVNGAFVIVNGYAATPEVINATSVAITNAGGSLTVEADGDTVITATSPAWAYYPDATGKYAYFGADVDGVKIKASDNHAFAGTFAGVWAYNDLAVVKDYGQIEDISLNATIENNSIVNVNWSKPVDSLNLIPFDPSNITIQPINPSIIDDNSVSLMSINNPGTYTDEITGLWTFNESSGNAFLITYLGTDVNNIPVPKVVRANNTDYPVIRIGHNSSLGTIIDNSSLNSGATLTIPDGVTTIVGGAFWGLSNLGGTLVLPSSITTLANATYPCFFSTSFDSLVLLGSITTVAGNVFGNTPIKEVLDVANSGITSTSYGLNADEVRSDVPYMGSIAPLSTTTVVTKEGTTYDLLSLLPLIMVLGVVMMGVYAVGMRYA